MVLMVCFDLNQCLSISLLTEQLFVKASPRLSLESDFSGLWLKEEDSPASPPPPALGDTWG